VRHARQRAVLPSTTDLQSKAIKSKRLANRRWGWPWICGIGGLPKPELRKPSASGCGEAIHAAD
jgi:hypothetical protein